MFKHPFVLIAVILGAIGILVATKQIETPKIFLPKANVIGVSLSLLPSTITLEPGAEMILDLSVDPAGEQISAIELDLSYDGSIIVVTDIIGSESLPQVLGKDLSKQGQATAILLAPPGASKGPSGAVGRIHIKAVDKGQTTLKLDSSTKVTALGKTGDVLGAVESAEVTVSGDTSAVNVVQEQIPATTQADNLIELYLNIPQSTDESKPESAFLGKYTKIVSGFIKNWVGNINLQIEDQARKLIK